MGPLLPLSLDVNNLPPDDANNKVLEYAVKAQFIYSMAGLVVGSFCMMLGAWLFGMGIIGNSDVTIGTDFFNTTLKNAAPGTLVFAVGLGVFIATRFQVNINSDAQASAKPKTK